MNLFSKSKRLVAWERITPRVSQTTIFAIVERGTWRG